MVVESQSSSHRDRGSGELFPLGRQVSDACFLKATEEAFPQKRSLEVHLLAQWLCTELANVRLWVPITAAQVVLVHFSLIRNSKQDPAAPKDRQKRGKASSRDGVQSGAIY